MNEQLRRIVISGTIREDSAAQFLEQVTALECIDMNKPISIYVDTYGGNLDAAMCMYDTIKACCCPVVTIGIGKVMSAGVLLLAAGDKGNRFITENTRVMVHEISSGTFGAISEMENSVLETRRMQDLYIELLAKDSNTNKTKILKDMEKETYMSAQETVNYGIADKLVPTRSCARKVTKKKKIKKKVA
ncbi:MAG: ClpP family protease, partial [Candidatus Njordarchaeales archaeon]